MESASLSELRDLTIEIFENVKLPPGLVVCVGSVSHLHRVGLTIYAQDWIRCVDTLSKGISGVRICPLIPIIKDNAAKNVLPFYPLQ